MGFDIANDATEGSDAIDDIDPPDAIALWGGTPDLSLLPREALVRAWREAVLGRFVGDGFHAVFAEFERVAFTVGAGPRATLAVEAVFLVHGEEEPGALGETGAGVAEGSGLEHGGEAGRGGARGTDLR